MIGPIIMSEKTELSRRVVLQGAAGLVPRVHSSRRLRQGAVGRRGGVSAPVAGADRRPGAERLPARRPRQTPSR